MNKTKIRSALTTLIWINFNRCRRYKLFSAPMDSADYSWRYWRGLHSSNHWWFYDTDCIVHLFQGQNDLWRGQIQPNCSRWLHSKSRHKSLVKPVELAGTLMLHWTQHQWLVRHGMTAIQVDRLESSRGSNSTLWSRLTIRKMTTLQASALPDGLKFSNVELSKVTSMLEVIVPSAKIARYLSQLNYESCLVHTVPNCTEGMVTFPSPIVVLKLVTENR